MKRPQLLSGLLVFLAIVGILTFVEYSINSSYVMSLPLWVRIFYIIISLVYLAASILLWKWKKIGFYIYSAAVLASMIVNFIAISSSASYLGFIGVFVLSFALRPVWKNFQ